MIVNSEFKESEHTQITYKIVDQAITRMLMNSNFIRLRNNKAGDRIRHSHMWDPSEGIRNKIYDYIRIEFLSYDYLVNEQAKIIIQISDFLIKHGHHKTGNFGEFTIGDECLYDFGKHLEIESYFCTGLLNVNDILSAYRGLKSNNIVLRNSFYKDLTKNKLLDDTLELYNEEIQAIKAGANSKSSYSFTDHNTTSSYIPQTRVDKMYFEELYKNPMKHIAFIEKSENFTNYYLAENIVRMCQLVVAHAQKLSDNLLQSVQSVFKIEKSSKFEGLTNKIDTRRNSIGKTSAIMINNVSNILTNPLARNSTSENVHLSPPSLKLFSNLSSAFNKAALHAIRNGYTEFNSYFLEAESYINRSIASANPLELQNCASYIKNTFYYTDRKAEYTYAFPALMASVVKFFLVDEAILLLLKTNNKGMKKLREEKDKKHGEQKDIRDKIHDLLKIDDLSDDLLNSHIGLPYQIKGFLEDNGANNFWGAYTIDSKNLNNYSEYLSLQSILFQNTLMKQAFTERPPYSEYLSKNILLDMLKQQGSFQILLTQINNSSEEEKEYNSKILIAAIKKMGINDSVDDLVRSVRSVIDIDSNLQIESATSYLTGKTEKKRLFSNRDVNVIIALTEACIPGIKEAYKDAQENKISTDLCSVFQDPQTLNTIVEYSIPESGITLREIVDNMSREEIESFKLHLSLLEREFSNKANQISGIYPQLSQQQIDNLMKLADASPKTIDYLVRLGHDKSDAESEYDTIRNDPFLYEYYICFLKNVSGAIIASWGITSGVLSDARQSTGENLFKVLGILAKATGLPGTSIIGSVIQKAASVWYARDRTKTIKILSETFPNQDAITIVEILSRKLALLQDERIRSIGRANIRDDLVQKVQDLGQWVQDGIPNTPIQNFALEQASELLEKIMNMNKPINVNIHTVNTLLTLAINRDFADIEIGRKKSLSQAESYKNISFVSNNNDLNPINKESNRYYLNENEVRQILSEIVDERLKRIRNGLGNPMSSAYHLKNTNHDLQSDLNMVDGLQLHQGHVANSNRVSGFFAR